MEIAVTVNEKLNEVGMQIRLLHSLITERNDFDRIKRLMYKINDDLDDIGASVIEMDNLVSQMAVNLERLKKNSNDTPNKRMRTAVVIDPDTNRINVKLSYKLFVNKYTDYKKRVKYYTYLYNVIDNQIKSLLLYNKMDNPDEMLLADVTVGRPTMRNGPYVDRLLQEYVDGNGNNNQ